MGTGSLRYKDWAIFRCSGFIQVLFHSFVIIESFRLEKTLKIIESALKTQAMGNGR